MTAASLRWQPGASPERTIATDESNAYLVVRMSRSEWRISVSDTYRLRDVRPLSGAPAPTRTLVAEYVALGEHFSCAAYGGKAHTTVAILATCEADAMRSTR